MKGKIFLCSPYVLAVGKLELSSTPCKYLDDYKRKNRPNKK